MCRLYIVNCWYVGFEGLPQKNRIFEIEQFQQYVTEFKVHYLQYPSYCRKFWELDPLRLKVRMISAVHHNNLMAIYTFLITGNFCGLDPLRLNFRVIWASLYLITIYLSDWWKIWELNFWYWTWFGSHFSSNHSICYTGTFW